MVSKHDISEYYSDPAVRRKILDQIRNRSVLAVNSRPGKENFTRRYNPNGEAIRITQANKKPDNRNDLAWYTDRRYSEFHPSIGKKTKHIWVDIDPGPKRDFESLKPVAIDVENMLKQLPNVKNTRITYSGGRGFHVKGQLHRKELTDDVRKMLAKHLSELPVAKSVTRKPRGDEVRLDISTLKNMGSVRADYSLNSETGRVAVPVTQRELQGFTPEQADVKRILKQKEFAPGVPRSKRIYALPENDKERQWTMAVQEHNARKAGLHWDFRLVDPATGFAHSWAVPKAALPEGDQKLLAIRTPTHTAHYALNYGDQAPAEITTGYGKGTVKLVHKEPVKVLQSNNDKIKLERIIGDEQRRLTLFRTKGDKWLMRDSTPHEKEGSAVNNIFESGYQQALMKLGLSRGLMRDPSTSEAAQPLDMQDEGTPTGQLVSMISGMDHPDYKKRRELGPDNHVERRLSRPTSFSTSQDIPSHFMDGATTPMTQAGI